MNTRYLTVEEVLFIHEASIILFGGTTGVRDINLLKSTVGAAKNIGGYTDDLFSIATRYMEGILINHPFIDGNKRTAFCAVDTFFRLNGIYLKVPYDVENTNSINYKKDDELYQYFVVCWIPCDNKLRSKQIYKDLKYLYKS